jgi:inorganic pyrophosphatase
MLHTNHQLYLDQFVGAKVLAIEVNEAQSRNIHTIEDYNRQNPGAIKEVREWFAENETLDG